MAQIRQSRPDSGLGLHVKVLESSNSSVPSSLGSGLATWDRIHAIREEWMVSSTPEPETRHPETEDLHPRPEIRNKYPGTPITKYRTRNPELETLNPKPGTRNPKPGTRNQVPEEQHAGRRRRVDTPPPLSHTQYQFNGFRKSTPPQKRHLI